MIDKILPQDPDKRRLSVIFLILGISIVIVTAFIGLKDNTPASLLCLLGVIIAFTAFVLHWEGNRNFQLLLFFSFVGLMFFVFFHNLSYGFMEKTEDNSILHSLLEVISIVTFLIAVFVFPAGIIISLSRLTYIFFKRIITKKKTKTTITVETKVEVETKEEIEVEIVEREKE